MASGRRDGAYAARPLWPCSRMTAWRQVTTVMVAADLLAGPHRSPKGLRHGFGVHAIASGVPLNILSPWMGHATLAVTAIDANALGAGFPSARLSALRRPGRQGVLAAGLDQPLGDGEAHQRAPDVGLRMPVGERRDDHAPGPGNTIAEQRQHVGRDPRDHGVEVGGGRGARRHADGRAGPPSLAKAVARILARSGIP
jgi:hypothetical protein